MNRHVLLLVATGRGYKRANVKVARRLNFHLIVVGLPAKMSASKQAKAFGDAWGKWTLPRPQRSREILDEKMGRKNLSTSACIREAMARRHGTAP